MRPGSLYVTRGNGLFLLKNAVYQPWNTYLGKLSRVRGSTRLTRSRSVLQAVCGSTRTRATAIKGLVHVGRRLRFVLFRRLVVRLKPKRGWVGGRARRACVVHIDRNAVTGARVPSRLSGAVAHVQTSVGSVNPNVAPLPRSPLAV